MKTLIFLLLNLIFGISFAIGQSDYYYDAKVALDIEKTEGFEVSEKHYQLLDSIFNSLEREIHIPDNFTKEDALNACKKINKILEEEFKFKYLQTDIFSVGLSNSVLDCNYYSLIFYTFLNKKKNFSVFPVYLPGHMFIRWHFKNGDYFNYETTDSKEISEAEYDSIFQVSPQAKKNKIYMADLNDKQIAAVNYVDLAFSIPIDSTEKILEICNRSINLDNNCVNALLMKGTAFVHKKDFKSATFIYNKILTYDSLNYKTYNNLAFLYFSQKDSKNAFNCLSKAISCNPNDPEPYINRAEFYFSEGDLENSMKDFDSATDHIKKCSFFQFSENYIQLDALEKAIMIEYLKQNGN